MASEGFADSAPQWYGKSTHGGRAREPKTAKARAKARKVRVWEHSKAMRLRAKAKTTRREAKAIGRSTTRARTVECKATGKRSARTWARDFQVTAMHVA